MEEIERLTNDPAYREAISTRQMAEYARQTSEFTQQVMATSPFPVFSTSTTPTPRTTGSLVAGLPLRREDEPVLPYLARVQEAALEAALRYLESTDPALRISRTPRGYVVQHRQTGQVLEIATQQEVPRAQP
jgi:hypothetical protein